MRNVIPYLSGIVLSLSLVQIALGTVLGQLGASGSQYRAKCEGSDTDQHWPCFQLKTGSLSDATLDPFSTRWDPNQFLFIKENFGDFSVADKTRAFRLSWDEDQMELDYYGQGENNCYGLTLMARGNHDIKITSDDGVVADTRRGEISNGRRYVSVPSICSKWAQIYLTR